MNQILFPLNLLRGALYFAVAYYIYLSRHKIEMVSTTVVTIFCVLLVMYGCFRLYRAVVDFQNSKNDVQ